MILSKLDIVAADWATKEQADIIPPQLTVPPLACRRIDRQRMDARTMHTVELLEQAITLAERSGFVVRQDWFGGAASGACEFKGRRWIFIDLALSPREQLDQVLDALSALSAVPEAAADPQLEKLLNLRKAA